MVAQVTPGVVGTFPLWPGSWYTAGDPHVRDVQLCTDSLAVDIETYGLGVDGRRIKAVCIADAQNALVLDPRRNGQKELIRDYIDRAEQLVFHNSPYDVPSLHLNGLLSVEHVRKVTDTLIYARLALPGNTVRKSLEELGRRFFGLTAEDTIKNVFKRLGIPVSQGYRHLDLDSPVYVMGNAADALITYRLLSVVRQAAYDRLTRGHPFSTKGVTGTEAWELVEREQVINRMMLRRACRGLRTDLDYLDTYRAENEALLHSYEAQLMAENVKPGNGISLMNRLSELGAVPASHPRTPKTGALSTAAASLERLRHPLAHMFVKAKQISKIDKDYLSKVNELTLDGRIYPVTDLLAAATGRMSMSNPPIHQFPAPARGAILADAADSLTSIDWSQIEPVVIANVAGDLRPLKGYEDGTSDLYQGIADFAGITRFTAKVVLLAQLYGEGLEKLGRDLDIGPDEAMKLREKVFSAMPATQRFVRKLRGIGEQFRLMMTISGRIVDVPVSSYNGRPSVATHKAVNYFVQGSAYDVLADNAVRIEKAGLGDAFYIFLHDEIVCSTDAAHDIRRIMETPTERLMAMSGRTPVLRTDMHVLGERWAKA